MKRASETIHGFDVDLVLAGLLDCILFSETDNADESGGESLDRNYSRDDFNAESVAKLRADVVKLLEAADPRDLESYTRVTPSPSGGAPDSYGRNDYVTEESFGHDLWFTSVGHGVGFWDRDYLDCEANAAGTLGDRLTALAKRFGEHWVHVTDGEIYVE